MTEPAAVVPPTEGRSAIGASAPAGPEVFRYGPAELEYLRARDPELGRAIDRIGRIERAVMPELFPALVHGIVAQQISGKAAAAVWDRLLAHFGEIAPGAVAGATLEEIRACGLSGRKAGYIRGIGRAVAGGGLRLAELPDLPDGEIVERLTALDGIGVWTAEMILIFCLQRPDVVSWGDLGIRRGMMRLYGLDALDRATFERCRARYSPHGSVASLYLWRIAAEP